MGLNSCNKHHLKLLQIEINKFVYGMCLTIIRMKLVQTYTHYSTHAPPEQNFRINDPSRFVSASIGTQLSFAN